jgi:phosphoglycerol transferase MdoB-like AlkP superfamily enzyme
MIFSSWKTWRGIWGFSPTFKLIRAFLTAPFLRFWSGFIYFVFLMSLWRLGFMLANFPDLNSEQFWIYIQAFYVGLRLDGVIAAVFMVPVFVSIWFFSPSRYTKLVTFYYLLVTLVISLLSLIDIFFFEEFNTHMNLLVLQENVMRSESILYLWSAYPLLRIGFLLAAMLWFGYHLLSRAETLFQRSPARWWQLIPGVLVSLVILFTALRGGWQERPIDWGHAFFSEDLLANQIALNGTFFLGRSAVELFSEKNIRQQLHRFSEGQARATTRYVLASPNESYINNNSMVRIRRNVHSIRPNIVLIVLESHTGSLCGYINPAETRVTPVLDSLAQNGLAFTRCFANGKRSAFGMSSILMSWPVLPGLPLISQLEATQRAPSLANNLRLIGYRNVFLYGGDSQFDNMGGFAQANGYDSVIDARDLPKLPGTMWGIFDHYIFSEALELLDSSEAPLQLTLFTTSNHQPWQVPDDYADRIPGFPGESFRDGAVHRSMAYVDKVLGEFMASASQKPWFDNTLFIFVADHGLTQFKTMYEDPRNGRIPLIMYSPKIITEPRYLDEYVSQVDIMPTLFGIIGYPLPYLSMGRDALSGSEAFFSRTSNDHFLWMEDDYLYGEVLGQKTNLYKVENLNDLILTPVALTDSLLNYYQDRHRSYLQTSFSQFKALGDD